MSCSDLGIDDDRVGKGSTAAPIVVVEPSPEVEITHPPRASFHAVGPVQVVGQVAAVDSLDPVQSVNIAGQTVPVAADGSFTATVSLDPGLNVLNASAVDSRGRAGSTAVGVLAGEWLAPGTPVQGGLAARLNDPALDAIGSVVERLGSTIDLNSLVQDPLYDGSLLGGTLTAKVDITNPNLNLVGATIDGEADGLHVIVKLDQVRLDINAVATAVGSPLIGPEQATVTADSAELHTRLRLVQEADRSLGILIEDSSVDFVNFNVRWNTGTLMPIILPLLRSWIGRFAEKQLAKLIDDLEQGLELSIDEALNPTVPTPVLNAQYLWDVRVDQVQHGISLALDDDVLNKALYAAWAGGALEMDLGALSLGGVGGSSTGSTASGSTASGPGFGGLAGPAPGPGLTVGDLALFLPEVLGAADPDAPITARIEAGLPPLFRVTGAPDLATLELGELRAQLMVDRGSGPELLVELVVHLEAGVTVAHVGNGLRLSSARHAEVSVDITQQPLVRFDERKVKVVLSTALTPLIPTLVNQVGVLPLPPEVSHLTLFNLRAYADGPAGDVLKVELDMAR
jgi:hypothetical protein